MHDVESHLENFRRLNGHAPAAVRDLRERALARFTALGFPATTQEDWKYTNLAPLARQVFQLPGAPTPDQLARAAALAETARWGTGNELVFVNGWHVPTLSSLQHLPSGVVVGSLAAALADRPGLVAPHLAQCAPFDDAGLVALNTAFIQDGAFLFLPDEYVLEDPIHCLFIALAADGAAVVHPHNLLVAGAGSQAAVVEDYVGEAGAAYWTNAVTELVVGPQATLAHYRLQREGTDAFHLATVAARQAADSQFGSHVVSLGAALSRSDVSTRLEDPGAECRFDGLYLATGRQHVDHHTTIDHLQPRGTSRELYKGILDGRATGVFNGKVFVRPGAQQSDAQQVNKNLLLSDDAEVDTKPQLEIFADDVKCSHGATIGQLDDDAIFYLRARGVDEPAARQMLIYAFANELIDRVQVEPLRRQLDREIGARFQGEDV